MWKATVRDKLLRSMDSRRAGSAVLECGRELESFGAQLAALGPNHQHGYRVRMPFDVGRFPPTHPPSLVSEVGMNGLA